MTNEKPVKEHKTVIFVDMAKFELQQNTITVREIIVDLAKADPSVSLLKLKHRGKTHKFENLDEVVTLENGMRFFIIDTRPTPVS